MTRLHLPSVVAASLVLVLGACTSTTVDEYRESSERLQLKGNETVVVLGRRHAANYETEPDFIDCIGKKLGRGTSLRVIGEPEFMDLVYPWFEPRTAPLGLKRMGKMLAEPMIGTRIRGQHIRYMIWVDGNTETTDREGSVSCAIGPGGGGCFGFATWEKPAAMKRLSGTWAIWPRMAGSRWKPRAPPTWSRWACPYRLLPRFRIRPAKASASN